MNRDSLECRLPVRQESKSDSLRNIERSLPSVVGYSRLAINQCCSGNAYSLWTNRVTSRSSEISRHRLRGGAERPCQGTRGGFFGEGVSQPATGFHARRADCARAQSLMERLAPAICSSRVKYADSVGTTEHPGTHVRRRIT